jgi:hypothetical protein
MTQSGGCEYEPIPVTFRILVKRSKHYRQYRLHVVADQIAEVFIVPEVKCPFSNLINQSVCIQKQEVESAYLEMGAGDRLGELIEQWFLDLGKLGGIHDLEDIFNLVKEHDFFGAVCLWPVSQQSKYDLDTCQREHLRKEKAFTSSVRAESFSRNWTIQYASWG